MNGKGSRPRPTKGDTYRARYDEIDWSGQRAAVSNQQSAISSQPEAESARYRCGKCDQEADETMPLTLEKHAPRCPLRLKAEC